MPGSLKLRCSGRTTATVLYGPIKSMEAPWRRRLCEFYFLRNAAVPAGGRSLSQNRSVTVPYCDQAPSRFPTRHALPRLVVLGHGEPDVYPSEVQ